MQKLDVVGCRQATVADDTPHVDGALASFLNRLTKITERAAFLPRHRLRLLPRAHHVATHNVRRVGNEAGTEEKSKWLKTKTTKCF